MNIATAQILFVAIIILLIVGIGLIYGDE